MLAGGPGGAAGAARRRAPSGSSASSGLPADRARELAFRTELADFYEQALAADGADARSGRARQLDPALVERIGSDSDPALVARQPGEPRRARGDGQRQGGQPGRRA